MSVQHVLPGAQNLSHGIVPKARACPSPESWCSVQQRGPCNNEGTPSVWFCPNQLFLSRHSQREWRVQWVDSLAWPREDRGRGRPVACPPSELSPPVCSPIFQATMLPPWAHRPLPPRFPRGLDWLRAYHDALATSISVGCMGAVLGIAPGSVFYPPSQTF